MDEIVTAGARAVASPEQLSATLGEEVVILGLRDSVYYGLNGVGTRIWELLQTPRTIAEITAIVVGEYQVSAEDAAADLRQLIEDLHARGLVALSPPDRG